MITVRKIMILKSYNFFNFFHYFDFSIWNIPQIFCQPYLSVIKRSSCYNSLFFLCCRHSILLTCDCEFRIYLSASDLTVSFLKNQCTNDASAVTTGPVVANLKDYQKLQDEMLPKADTRPLIAGRLFLRQMISLPILQLSHFKVRIKLWQLEKFHTPRRFCITRHLMIWLKKLR